MDNENIMENVVDTTEIVEEVSNKLDKRSFGIGVGVGVIIPTLTTVVKHFVAPKVVGFIKSKREAKVAKKEPEHIETEEK